MKKSVIAILTAAIITLSFLGPMLFISTVQAQDPADWYKTINGVLSSDYYSLYPYATESLDIGISKYGEMIDGTHPLPDVGLQYPGYEEVGTYDQTLETSRDPFANEGISKNLWLNGWLLEVRYTHRTKRDRRLLAAAMFADMTSFGKDWLNGHPLPLENSPFGGRKTTGYVETEPLQVLYDGPRRFVALCTNHIYDWHDGNEDGVVDHPDETWPIIDLKLTFIFNKVKKEVIILKDVKIAISGKELDSPLDVQFSNREEWDLGPEPDWASYAHFYHQEWPTCYGPEWHLANGIMREYVYKDAGEIPGVPVLDSRDPYGPPIVDGSVRVYVNGEFKEEGIDYYLDYDTGAITWYMYVAPTDEVEVVYKLYKIETLGVGVPHLYDVAQIISSDLKYVGWKAFWPTLSDYTVDGWTMSFIPLINVSQPNIIPTEPEIPFVIGEWDFMLGKGYPEQFRGVEVVGLTDWHDADDENIIDGVHTNIIDKEVQYQLDEVFNPWDLLSAVHKKTTRWVEFFDGDGTTTTFTLAWLPLEVVWDEYCSFAERVMCDCDDSGGFDPDEVLVRDVDYTINFTTGVINFTVAPPLGVENIKVLYSTDNVYEVVDDNLFGPGRYEWFVVGRDAHSVDSLGTGYVTATLKQKNVTIGRGGMDIIFEESGIQSVPSILHKFGTGNALADYHFDYAGGDHRTALKDDWCDRISVYTTWPISSSNIITLGGPLINGLTWYVNDFNEAYYGTSDFAYYGVGAVNALTCWNKNYYYSTEDTGYAAISTYKDINGTVILSLWGVWGRDTYYAGQWFHDHIEYLQGLNPCVTSIILEIDYTDPEHPAFSVVEHLGTISEKLPIHPDP